MSAVLWVLGVLVYLAVGVGVARLRAWQVFRGGQAFNGYDLRAEMLGLMFVWPLLAPCYLLAMAIRWALFPRSLR